jgi:ligand-binding SRPBCC domain-containing protein
MKTHQLTYQCTIDATPREVCAFHTDTRNLPLITPPWVNVMIMSMDVPMRLESQVELSIKRFGIPTCWKMKLSELECPHKLTDKMLDGPFPYFHHQRLFTPTEGSKTKMEETITLAMPFSVIGRALFPLVKRDMDRMFAYRHAATQRYFEEKKNLREKGSV